LPLIPPESGSVRTPREWPYGEHDPPLSISLSSPVWGSSAPPSFRSLGWHRVCGNRVHDDGVFRHFLKHYGDPPSGVPTECSGTTARSAHFDIAFLVAHHFLDLLAYQAVPLHADVPVIAVPVVFVIPDDGDVAHRPISQTIFPRLILTLRHY